jgi:hypothetical protein
MDMPIDIQKSFFQRFGAGISTLSTRFLLFEQENLPQRHRVTEKRIFIKNSVSPCLCGSILFGSGLSGLGDFFFIFHPQIP